MKRILLVLGCAFVIIPTLKAQEFDRVQVGVFADYFRSNPTDTNMFGVGRRVGFRTWRYVKLEAQMAYDFNQIFTEGVNNTAGGNITFQNTGVRVLHGSFGPKIDLGHRAFHPFLYAKGGFVNYMFDARNASFATFASSVDRLRTDDAGVFGRRRSGRAHRPDWTAAGCRATRWCSTTERITIWRSRLDRLSGFESEG